MYMNKTSGGGFCNILGRYVRRDGLQNINGDQSYLVEPTGTPSSASCKAPTPAMITAIQPPPGAVRTTKLIDWVFELSIRPRAGHRPGAGTESQSISSDTTYPAALPRRQRSNFLPSTGDDGISKYSPARYAYGPHPAGRRGGHCRSSSWQARPSAW